MYGMCFLSKKSYGRGLEKDVGELGGGGCRLYTFRQKWTDLKRDFEEGGEVRLYSLHIIAALENCIYGTGVK